MIFLSFSKVFKFSFTIFLLFIFSSVSLYSQTRIKEKVIINPNVKSLHLSKSTVEYSPLIFGFGGPKPFSYSISGPGGSAAGNNPGEGAPATEVSIPAVNGEYHVTVTSSCECNTNVGYYVVWQDPSGSTQWIAGYEMWFYGPHVSGDTFTFNGIPPPPPPFDFSILLSKHLVYGTQESIINFWYNGESESLTDKSVTLSFANGDPDVIFYDRYLEQNIGNTFTTTLDDSYNFSVKSNSVATNYPKHITVTAVSNGLQRSDTLMIEQPNSVRAYFEKPNLSPGDTVNIIVKKVDTKYGRESNYPDTTHFEVGIKNGCGFGLILDINGEKKDYFRSIQQPIRFVVADSLSVDADSVILRVGAPVIPDGAIIAGSVETTGSFLKKNKKVIDRNIAVNAEQNMNKKRTLKTLDDNSCAVYDPLYKKNFNNAKATFYKLEIIYPKANLENETISSVPQMPTVTCKARLNNYKGGQVTFKWEYWASNYLQRSGKRCARVGKIMFGGKSPANNSEITEWIVPFKKDSAWSISLEAISQKNCDQIITTWDYSDDVFTGGNVWIKVIALDKNGIELAHDTLSANKILGLNPILNEIKAYTNNNLELIALIQQESSGGLQFIDGYPQYGAPNGWGLMMLDNYGTKDDPKYATELELWNWKKNVDTGKDLYYNFKRPMAIRHLTKWLNLNQLTNEQILKEAWQLYNGAWFNKTDKKSYGYWKPRLNENGVVTLIKITPYNHSDFCWKYYKALGGN